jgi:beta-phosphoglucomutase-like phosphatase (HAD superfamily)
VVFDCDGVLVDSEPVSYLAWQDALAAFGHDLTPAEFAPSIGTTDWMVAEKWATRLETTPHVLDALAKEFFLARVGDITVFEDAQELRASLVVPSAVGTNSERWRLDAILTSSGLDRLFPTSITASDVAAPKPAPDIYAAAFSAIGVAPERGVVIEDSPSGISAAKAVGAFVVAIDRGHLDRAQLSSADLVVDSLRGV